MPSISAPVQSSDLQISQTRIASPEVSQETLQASVVVKATEPRTVRGLRFWFVFVALCCSMLLSSLDLGGVATAAPTIVDDLNGSDFTWVGSAYSLACAACLPFNGNLAQVFGRRPVLLVALTVFAVGSAVSAAAPSMSVLIGGRAIQGVGGGGIQSLTQIVVSDLIPLRDRGIFNGIIGLIWTFGSLAGPFIAGSLAEKVTWRWIFYMNLPLCAVAFVIVALALDLPTPREKFWLKFSKIDWTGNFLIVSSTASCLIALAWAGVQHPWSSPQVLVPLIVGIVGFIFAVLYELRWCENPTIPKVVVTNRTSLIGFIATFLHGVVIISAGYYLPTWFQSVRVASPIVSGLDFFPISGTMSISAIVQGLLVAKTGRYRVVNSIGWSFAVLGMGLLISLNVTTNIGIIIVYELILGVGLGWLYSTTYLVLAPIPVANNAAAVSLLAFCRTFSQAWGIAIAGTILQNDLRSRLPENVTSSYSSRTSLVYKVISTISSMSEPTKGAVQQAFLESMRTVWIVMAALAGVGFLTFFGTKDLPLHTKTDKKWDMQQKKDGTAKNNIEPEAEEKV